MNQIPHAYTINIESYILLKHYLKGKQILKDKIGLKQMATIIHQN